ncbi:MAG: NADH-quinone oxidoreductase subunit A [Bacteriovoracaceae bacterium]|nr:NADH-quinone oxidoreductase subunit A [Bacteriovoracaceae bacterium]
MQADSAALISYTAVIAMIAVALILTTVLLTINKILGQRPTERTRKKDDTYECGVDYVGSGHQQFSVRYYLVALIFLLFDVEVVFMYPWTLTYKNYLATSGGFIVWEVVLFSMILLGGYIYLRLRGAFDWD